MFQTSAFLKKTTISAMIIIGLFLVLGPAAGATQLLRFLVSSDGGYTTCSTTFNVYGYQTGPTTWITEMVPSISNPNYTWALGDANGVIASGGWINGQGATGDLLANFSTTRVPIGTLSQMTFFIRGSGSINSEGQQCTFGFDATIPASSGGSGYFAFQ